MSVDTELRDPGHREQTTAPGDPSVAGSQSSRRRDALIIVVALLVGMGAVAGFGALTGSDDEPSATIDADADVSAASAPPAQRDGTVAAGTPAASPTDAVEQFLAAEAEGDFETSYAMLSENQRAEYGSPAAWTNAHADFFPVTDFDIVETSEAVVVADLRYRSSLDEVVGLVPARARVEWPTVAEGDGWLVDFDAAVVEPRFPDEGEALEAVSEWARTHQQCREPMQYAGALVATADLLRVVDGLCDTSARIATPGPPRALDEFDASAFVSAFGTAALSWARAVDVGGPVELTVVVAPVDDRWLVIGLLPPA